MTQLFLNESYKVLQNYFLYVKITNANKNNKNAKTGKEQMSLKIELWCKQVK